MIETIGLSVGLYCRGQIFTSQVAEALAGGEGKPLMPLDMNSGGVAGKVVRVIEREDLGSWLNGAPSDQEYPGQHMGRPQSGPGSFLRPMRRIIAFVFDWYLCFGLLWLCNLGGSSILENLLLLGLVWFYQVITVGFMGHTLGHLLVGAQVQTLAGKPAGWVTALVRATLVMLVLPVIIMDADQRGLHDRVRATALVRIR